MTQERKINRRNFITAVAAAAGLGIGFAGGWLAKPPEVTRPTGVAVTVTETRTVTAPLALPKIPILPPGERNPWLYDELRGVRIKSVHDAFAGRVLEWYADLLRNEVGVEIGTTKLVDIPLLKEEGFGLLEARSTEFQLIQITPSFLADFVLTGRVEPLDKYYNAFYGSDEYLEQIITPYREFYMKYRGNYYAIPWDGDVHLWNYLYPFYENERFRTAYRDWHPQGRSLAPPDTWDEWLLQCRFFKTKVLPDDKTIPGAEVLWPTMVWAVPPWGWAFYFNVAASYGVNYFNEDMSQPLFPRDRAIAAMEKFVQFVEYMPEGVENFGSTETVEYWLGGKVVSQIWWIDINEWGQVPPVKGYLKNALMPGYPDPAKGKIVHRAMMPYNRAWIIPNYLDEKTKKAAFYVGYHVSHWHYSLWNAADYDCGVDPYMYIHTGIIGAERYTKSNPYKKPSQDWPHRDPLFPDVATAISHLQGAIANLSVGFPQPVLPGTVEFQESLSREVQLAISGSKSPREAVNDAAAQWANIRDRYMSIVGRDRYLEIWRDFYAKMRALGYI